MPKIPSLCGADYGAQCATCDIAGCSETLLAIARAARTGDLDSLTGRTGAAIISLLDPAPAGSGVVQGLPHRRLRIVR